MDVIVWSFTSRELWPFFFFFQAEDGIRDYKVTGVQTCALPIWRGRAGGQRVPRVHGTAPNRTGMAVSRRGERRSRVIAGLRGDTHEGGRAGGPTDRKSVV